VLLVGQTLELPRHGGRWRVGEVVGEGSQGIVFQLVSEDRPDAPVLALKWYRPETSHPDQWAALRKLAQSPPPSDCFIWPVEVLGTPPDFGYVMALRSPRYRPINDLLMGADVPFSVVVRLCLGLADSFLKLHALGLCYRDISLGNVFFDPATGQPMICDNDNVTVDGGHPAQVLGTARFMAPEIVRREAQPSTATDLYSLAVLLFYLLMFHHPLEGRRELEYPCLDAEADRRLFGTEPLFVFDPDDSSNAPVPGVHRAVLRYWPLYPEFLHDDFRRAFTAGLHDPARRVREGVWRSHLARLLDGIAYCVCGRENFTDDGRPLGPCWACGASITAPVRLQFGSRVLVLNAETQVTRHHLQRDYAYDDVVGVVSPHPGRPDVWGLRNVGARPWRAVLAGGDTRTVDPGRSVGLVVGTTIDFGGVVATLQG